MGEGVVWHGVARSQSWFIVIAGGEGVFNLSRSTLFQGLVVWSQPQAGAASVCARFLQC